MDEPTRRVSFHRPRTSRSQLDPWNRPGISAQTGQSRGFFYSGTQVGRWSRRLAVGENVEVVRGIATR
jgi:hypothetical protein